MAESSVYAKPPDARSPKVSFVYCLYPLPFTLAPSKVKQRAKKVVSDSPGLVDFTIGLVNSVFNLPDGQVMFFEEFE